MEDNTTITKRELIEMKLKYRAGKCSFLLLLFGMITIVFTGLISIAVSLLAKNNFNILVSKNEYTKVLMQMSPCIIIDIIVIIIGMKITKIEFKDIFKRCSYSKDMVVLSMLSCGGVVFISSMITMIIVIIAHVIHMKIPSPDFSFPNALGLRMFYISYVCILGPILEEILFRGIILNYLKKYGQLIAILFSTMLFTMFHLNLMQFATPVLLGSLLGFLTVKTESIKPSIMVHMFNNTVVTILSVILGTSKAFYTSVTLIYFMIGLLALGLFVFKHYKDFIEITNDNSVALSLKNKIKCCVINPWFIAYLSFYLVIIIVNFVAENINKYYR